MFEKSGMPPVFPESAYEKIRFLPVAGIIHSTDGQHRSNTGNRAGTAYRIQLRIPGRAGYPVVVICGVGHLVLEKNESPGRGGHKRLTPAVP